MRILVVDDEQLARQRMIRIISEQLKGHEVVGEAKNGQEALEKIQNLHPEVVILDIRMPGIDGLEVARHLMKLETPPAVIFSTAYDEHAIDAFKVNAIDYLLKPVRGEQLEAALLKAMRPNKAQLSAFSKADTDKDHVRTHISARIRGSLMLIPIEEVYYFRAGHKYVTVRYKEGEALIEDPLKELEEDFPDRLVRIHRSALAAVHAIRSLDKGIESTYIMRFTDINDTVEVSRRHLSKIRAMMT